jgi:hypothetical protein
MRVVVDGEVRFETEADYSDIESAPRQLTADSGFFIIGLALHGGSGRLLWEILQMSGTMLNSRTETVPPNSPCLNRRFSDRLKKLTAAF